jgi:hypothetical protein
MKNSFYILAMNGFRDLYFSCDSSFSLLLVAAPKEWQRSHPEYQTTSGASFAYVSHRRAMAIRALKLPYTSWVNPLNPSTPTLAFQKFISVRFK